MKEINTGKCEILAVMVPKQASDLTIPKIGIIDLYFDNKNSIEEDYISITIPQAKWEIVGIQTELTEGQWGEILPRFGLYPNYSVIGSMFKTTAKESGLSLLEANHCYSVNPYVHPCNFSVMDEDEYDELYCEWKEAQSNTGKWLILRKL